MHTYTHTHIHKQFMQYGLGLYMVCLFLLNLSLLPLQTDDTGVSGHAVRPWCVCVCVCVRVSAEFPVCFVVCGPCVCVCHEARERQANGAPRVVFTFVFMRVFSWETLQPSYLKITSSLELALPLFHLYLRFSHLSPIKPQDLCSSSSSPLWCSCLSSLRHVFVYACCLLMVVLHGQFSVDCYNTLSDQNWDIICPRYN